MGSHRGNVKGGPAIVALREAIEKCHGGSIIPELLSAGASQANGAIELMTRTMRHGESIQRPDRGTVQDQDRDSRTNTTLNNTMVSYVVQ